ncbi:4-oxalomesaconate tautomerase [Pseudofrankia saprophytica]|uniref:4-oxalomesaconate tautomerase n=1 Tax=Pseudofrankia saprophytica TaxID=298655 RepID=UPI000234BF3D|nr:4-oxalomesaconate tautomerase [Pseudofrankia saprophytica]
MTSHDDIGVRAMMMRGGTSRGLYFLASDLPANPAERDDLLLRLMGTPDPLQIDGLGGATSLTSKVAVVSPAADGQADVDYLFLQLGVDEATVSDRQNCGNILAGVGPFALERGLVRGGAQTADGLATVRIRMVNTNSMAVARFPGPGGRPDYRGDTAIAGVPGTAAAVSLAFTGTEGSTTGRLLPTGRVRDVVDGVQVTCVDNGMPVVLAEAASLGLDGSEPPDLLRSDATLRERIDALRRAAADAMGLGDVRGAPVPKTVLVSPPRDGGHVATRSFIPVQPHTTIGVLAAISAVTGMLIPDAVGHGLAARRPAGARFVDVEHPTGHLLVDVEVDTTSQPVRVRRSGVVRTARKLFDGVAFPRDH